MVFWYSKVELDEFRANPRQYKKRKDINPRKWQGIFIDKATDKVVNTQGHEIIADEDIDSVLLELWKDPETGFVGRDKLYEKSRERFRGISKDRVMVFLRRNQVANIHTAVKKERIVKPIVVKKPMKHLQMDLITGFYGHGHLNGGYKIIFTVIDCNTKYAWAVATKTKTSAEIAEKLKDILDEIHDTMGEYPALVQSDRGPEFSAPKADSMPDEEYLSRGGGKEVGRLLADCGIKQVFSQAYTPQTNGMIERFNGTIKKRLGQWFTQNGTHKWVDVLPKFVNNYNNTVHSTTRAKPDELFKGVLAKNPEKSEEQTAKLRERANELIEEKAQKVLDRQDFLPQLEIGDWVRVSLLTESEERKADAINNRKAGMSRNWTDRLFKVSEVHIGKSNSRERYLLVDRKGNLLKGFYYRTRLLKATAPQEVINKPPVKEKADRKQILEAKLDNLNEEEAQKMIALREKLLEEPIADRLREKIVVKKPEKIKVAARTAAPAVPILARTAASVAHTAAPLQQARTASMAIKPPEPPPEAPKPQAEPPKAPKPPKPSATKPKKAKDVFEPEAIRSHKKEHNQLFYEVKWEGYPESDNTFEPQKNFISPAAKELLKEYKYKVGILKK